MKVFWGRLVLTNARSDCEKEQNSQARGLKRSEYLKLMSMYGISFRVTISVYNLIKT